LPTIYIDNMPYNVPDGQNLLQVCLALGFDLPYFCWHPAMHSVGACRQCAVKLFRDEQDKRGRIVMSCMTPAAEGTRISVEDPEARAFRAGIIEMLMLNHPHDCPVCDEGGECHLQDMTVLTGHDYRRTRFPKRTHRNQNLGPFVTHEMNRCIQCYRCVRFYRDHAGGRDLDVLGWHDHVYFGRQQSGRLESEFSGNLVEVCPTGVFTDKSLYSHYTRKWDLQVAPSVCVHCGVGCNTIPGERYGGVRRIRSRYNAAVNGFFLCDRGRYGYEFVNGPQRLRSVEKQGLRPISSSESVSVPVSPVSTSCLNQGQTPISQTKSNSVPDSNNDVSADCFASIRAGKAVGIGSPRASLESNFALRDLVGAARFHSGMAPQEDRLLAKMIAILRAGPAPAASLQRIRQAQAVLVLGEDLTNVAPMMDLAVRQAARQKPMKLAIAKHKLAAWDDAAIRYAVGPELGPVFIATPAPTKLDEIAAATFRAAPDDLIHLAAEVAQRVALDTGGTPVRLTAEAPILQETSQETLAMKISRELLAADNPVIICGPSLGSEALLESAAAVASALAARGKDVAIALVTPECNSMGLALMEAQPLDAALPALKSGQADTLVILENDLYRRLPAAQVDELLAAATRVVVLDHTRTPTLQRADLALPASTFAESSGTLVNHEGRAQRFFQVFVCPAPVKESWRWLGPWRNLDEVLAAMADALPALAGAAGAAPNADFRMNGQRVPRQPHRYSGRTAMSANRSVHEPPPPADVDSPLSFSMEGSDAVPPAPLLANYWTPSWNSHNALNKFQDELGPDLENCVSGVRLIEGQTKSEGRGAKGEERNNEETTKSGAAWLIVPAFHIFGSEELSAMSPSIAQLAPAPYVAMNEADATKLALREGDLLNVRVGVGNPMSLALKIIPALPSGLAVVPSGVGNLVGLSLPAWGQIEKSAPSGEGGAT
jgi:NADH-quinone oxidoreductase subunit G